MWVWKGRHGAGVGEGWGHFFSQVTPVVVQLGGKFGSGPNMLFQRRVTACVLRAMRAPVAAVFLFKGTRVWSFLAAAVDSKWRVSPFGILTGVFRFQVLIYQAQCVVRRTDMPVGLFVVRRSLKVDGHGHGHECMGAIWSLVFLHFHFVCADVPIKRKALVTDKMKGISHPSETRAGAGWRQRLWVRPHCVFRQSVALGVVFVLKSHTGMIGLGRSCGQQVQSFADWHFMVISAFKS